MVNIRSKHIGRDIAVGFKNIVGGELKGYTELLQAVQHLGISVAGAKAEFPHVQEAQLFAGSVVISSDFFKTFIAGLLNLIGGEISTYESLLDRARREAMLRMEEAALAWGANQVVNVRIQTAELSANSGQGVVAVEVIAYGTALR